MYAISKISVVLASMASAGHCMDMAGRVGTAAKSLAELQADCLTHYTTFISQ